MAATPLDHVETPALRRRVVESTPTFEAEQADRPTGRGSASSMSGGSSGAAAASAAGRSASDRSAADGSASRRRSTDEPAGFDALFAGLGDADGDTPAERSQRGERARGSRTAEKPKRATKAKKPTRAEKAVAKREAAARTTTGPRRGGAVPPVSPGVDVDLALLVSGATAIAGSSSAPRGASSATDTLESIQPERRQRRSAPEAGRVEASAVVPRVDATAGFAAAIAAAAGAYPGADTAIAPAAAQLNFESPVRRGSSAGVAESTAVPADITGVSELLDFGPAPDVTPDPAPGVASRRATRGATPRDSAAPRDAARAAAPARRRAPEAATRPTPRPAASAPRRRRGARQLASLVAMSFAALLAVATTIPSLSLLTPEDVQALAMADTIGMTEDGQHVEIDGDIVAQIVQREGYEHQSMEEYARAAGIRAEADFINNPAGTIQWPFAVGVHVGDRFGYRSCYGCSSDHGGQDFNPGLGAEIQAIADGTVSVSTDSGGSLGVVMMIDHIIDGELITSVYAHMEYGSRLFEVGDTVGVADVIGTTGSTGMSTGPHLHFEIRIGGVDGTKVDPLEWLYANTN